MGTILVHGGSWPQTGGYVQGNLEQEYWNLSTPALYEQIVRFREGVVAHLGPVVVRTGQHTGRSPRDKFIVKEITTENEIAMIFKRKSIP